MAIQYVFYNRQAEAGAAGGARTAAIYSVKALRETRYVLLRKAFAGIVNSEYRFRAGLFPGEVDCAAGRRVTHRVTDEIRECTAQFVAVADKPEFAHGGFDLMPAARQLFGVDMGWRQMEAVKFNRLVLPETTLTLRLELRDDRSRLHFSYTNDGVACSSGRLIQRE